MEALSCKKQKKKENRNHAKAPFFKGQQEKAFWNFTWFLDHFPYSAERPPSAPAAGRSTAGGKVWMTFLTALRLNTKGLELPTASPEMNQ